MVVTRNKRQSADPTSDFDEAGGELTLVAGVATFNVATIGWTSVSHATATSQANETIRYSVAGTTVTFTSSSGVSTAVIGVNIWGK